MSKYAKEVEDGLQKAPHSWEVHVARISSENILIPNLYICFIILWFFLIIVLIVFCSHRPMGHKYFINWSILFDSSYISLSQTWWEEHFFDGYYLLWVSTSLDFWKDMNQPLWSSAITFASILNHRSNVGSVDWGSPYVGMLLGTRGERWLTFILQGPSGPV